MNAETLREFAVRLNECRKDAPAKTAADVSDVALAIMNEFMSWPASGGVEPFPFDHFWQRKVAVLCERVADAERRLRNAGSFVEGYAKSLDGLDLWKLHIGGDTFDGARDKRAIRHVVEHLLKR